jgi:uroporphyrin-III C-methyltransferase
MTAALLTATYADNHVYLIIGSNALAGARCAKSIEVGAKPKLIAADGSGLHYGLTKKIDDGAVEWLKRDFQDNDLTTLGRADVDYVVDTVFVTLGGHHPLSTLQTS